MKRNLLRQWARKQTFAGDSFEATKNVQHGSRKRCSETADNYFSRRVDFQLGACHSQTWTSSKAFGRSMRPISMLADSGVAG